MQTYQNLSYSGPMYPYVQGTAPLSAPSSAQLIYGGVPTPPVNNEPGNMLNWLAALRVYTEHYRLAHAKLNISDSNVWTHLVTSFKPGSSMLRNAQDFDEIFKRRWHALRIKENTSSNITITLANVGKPAEERQALLDVSPYLPPSSSSVRVPHSWVLPAESDEEAYEKYIKMPKVSGEASRIALEDSIRGVLAHALQENGQVLANCSYSATPITATTNLEHLGQRAPEAFMNFLHSKYVLCSKKDLTAFLALRREPGQSAQDFGNHYLEVLRYLCSTSNGLHAPPLSEHQPLLIRALGGKAELIEGFLHSKSWPPMSLEQIIQRCYEWDQSDNASVISHSATAPSPNWDVESLTPSARAQLLKKLNMYTPLIQTPSIAAPQAAAAAPAVNPPSKLPNSNCYIHGAGHLNKTCREQISQGSQPPSHTIAVNSAPPSHRPSVRTSLGRGCFCCGDTHPVNECIIAGNQPAPASMQLTTLQWSLLQENLRRKARGITWIGMTAWESQSHTAPPPSAPTAALCSHTGPLPQTTGGRALYAQAVAETVETNRQKMASTFTAPPQQTRHWEHPAQDLTEGEWDAVEPHAGSAQHSAFIISQVTEGASLEAHGTKPCWDQDAESQELNPDTHQVTLTNTADTDLAAHQGQLMRQGDENGSHSQECLLTYPCADTQPFGLCYSSCDKSPWILEPGDSISTSPIQARHSPSDKQQ